ncbi:MAG TPA: hypothetical protein EYP56_06915 [Planctomycetaceae bacterium]|nr:hypothetical protein [Planctomycetaceae bacterium]
MGDSGLRPGQWAICSKPCVTDWNADGRLDLLVGDSCGGFLAKPKQTEAELAEQLQAIQQLPVLRRRWAEAFGAYREHLAAEAGRELSADQQRRRAALIAQIQRLQDEIVKALDTIGRYAPRRQRHGFVWLFLRKPSSR